MWKTRLLFHQVNLVRRNLFNLIGIKMKEFREKNEIKSKDFIKTFVIS